MTILRHGTLRQLATRWLSALLFMLTLILLAGSTALAQKTIISGKIVDAETKEPLPFVNVVFKGSKIGTTSDFDGNYRLETYYPSDSLQISSVGYIPQTKKVKKDETQVINFTVEAGAVQLREVVIKADKKAENPAHPIIRNVIANKKINNREKLGAYEYETYNKIEFDVNNIDEEFRNKRVLKPFQFVFDNIDSSEAKPFLPLFMTESISNHYYRKDPKAQREVIHATKVSGVENKSVSQFLGDMYQNVNIYDNYITAFGKSFVSPISDFGFLSYKYYLLDSVSLDGFKCYKIRYTPRRKSELTFEGDLWIADTTFAVKQVEATILKDANINFINEFSVYQEYNQVEKEVWMLTNDQLVVDFTLSNKTIGFYGRKKSSYRNFVINTPHEDGFYKSASNVIVDDSASLKSDEYWTQSRHVELSENEKKIYAMVDTIKQIPAFRTYVDIITLVVSGYYEAGLFELGPYFTTVSFNQVEGARFRLGGRTSNKFSTRLALEGYAAYGLKDENFKYMGGFQYFLSKSPRQRIGASYRKDLEQLGTSANAWRTDNILTSLFRRNPANQLNGFEEYKTFYEMEWFDGFSNRISFEKRDIWSLGSLNFQTPTSDVTPADVSRISTAEVGLYARFAYKEKFLSGEFERVSLGSKYPAIQAQLTLGLKGAFDSDYEYQKLVINIQDKIQLNPFGHTNVVLEVGKIWGTLPYPLLKLHNGNETYFYDSYAYNLMNFYEFVSDEYVSLFAVHHFNGLFLNKIPLMRKLKWREVASFRMAAGDFSEANRRELLFPEGLTVLKKPYYEAGVGIENIFKVIRVDALWRLSYLDNPDVIPFGFRGALQIAF